MQSSIVNELFYEQDNQQDRFSAASPAAPPSRVFLSYSAFLQLSFLFIARHASHSYLKQPNPHCLLLAGYHLARQRLQPDKLGRGGRVGRTLQSGNSSLQQEYWAFCCTTAGNTFALKIPSEPSPT